MTEEERERMLLKITDEAIDEARSSEEFGLDNDQIRWALLQITKHRAPGDIAHQLAGEGGGLPDGIKPYEGDIDYLHAWLTAWRKTYKGK